jgi:hypothetical protein
MYRETSLIFSQKGNRTHPLVGSATICTSQCEKIHCIVHPLQQCLCDSFLLTNLVEKHLDRNSQCTMVVVPVKINRNQIIIWIIISTDAIHN